MTEQDLTLKPNYKGKCITKVPETVNSLLGANYEHSLLDGKAKKVLLILVDSLGYENLMRIAASEEELSELVDEFELQKVSSVFPPSTTAGLASIEGGETPEEHSLFAWMIYSKKLNMRFYPLKFESVDEENDRKFERKADKSLIAHGSVFDDLAEEGVNVYRINPERIVGNEFSGAEDSRSEGYSNLVEAFVRTRKLIEGEEDRSFFYLYLSHYDTSDHDNGPYSEESKSLIKEIFRLAEEEIFEKLENIEVIITADHGCSEVKNRVEIRENDDLGKEIYPNLKTHYGKRIFPAGEPRNVYLHIKKGSTEKVVENLRGRLKGKARVFRTDELIEENLFGTGEPSRSFLENIGNVTILPEKNTGIYFDSYLDKKDEGAHGGLTGEEMYVPFLSRRV